MDCVLSPKLLQGFQWNLSIIIKLITTGSLHQNLWTGHRNFEHWSADLPPSWTLKSGYDTHSNLNIGRPSTVHLVTVGRHSGVGDNRPTSRRQKYRHAFQNNTGLLYMKENSYVQCIMTKTNRRPMVDEQKLGKSDGCWSIVDRRFDWFWLIFLDRQTVCLCHLITYIIVGRQSPNIGRWSTVIRQMTTRLSVDHKHWFVLYYLQCMNIFNLKLMHTFFMLPTIRITQEWWNK